MVTIQTLIMKNDRDIALFQSYCRRLTGQAGTRQAIGDLERRITMAERSNAILRAAR
jgi:hypothetical protein